MFTYFFIIGFAESSLLHSDFLLVADKWGALFAAEPRLLTVLASLVVEHRP